MPRQRPKPVEDIQDRARQEQAIAPRTIGNDENSGIDKPRGRGVDAREGAADGMAGIRDGEGRACQRKRREFVDHAVRPEARNGAAPLRLDGCKVRDTVKVRRRKESMRRVHAVISAEIRAVLSAST